LCQIPPEKLETEMCLSSGVFSFVTHMFCLLLLVASWAFLCW